jgi:hypothetical protein
MHNDYIELTKNIFALYQKLTRKHSLGSILYSFKPPLFPSRESAGFLVIIFDLFTLPSITNLPELLEPLSLLDGNPTLSRKFLGIFTLVVIYYIIY